MIDYRKPENFVKHAINQTYAVIKSVIGHFGLRKTLIISHQCKICFELHNSFVMLYISSEEIISSFKNIINKLSPYCVCGKVMQYIGYYYISEAELTFGGRKPSKRVIIVAIKTPFDFYEITSIPVIRDENDNITGYGESYTLSKEKTDFDPIFLGIYP